MVGSNLVYPYSMVITLSQPSYPNIPEIRFFMMVLQQDVAILTFSVRRTVFVKFRIGNPCSEIC